MLKSIQSNNSPGHSHNRLPSVVDLSVDSCPGIILKRNKTMKIGIVTDTNKMVHNGVKDQKVTIIKEYFYNGEGWYLTKEIGEIPNIFVEEIIK